ncbi:hypothetical protein EW026_g4991 [Hermanssonia centrifuga]|uniref:Porphobilinogen deaminase n=1 Tax=Hermanssonia centrifuga TaxID=98765 RepID=A0A4S4KFW8_9APHY|nr:hypothetical protein EW026_g4991 [Hermanssonia centrifuga]
MSSNETSATGSRKFILASRASQLAQIQTNMVRDALQAAFPDLSFETSFMTTGGDHNQSQALYLLGGKSLWTKELEVALQEGVVDMLVHSYKDVPTVLPEGCEISGVLEREDPVDSLVVRKDLPWKSLEELPEGAVVGTSSVRRVAQLKRLFPKLLFRDVRGNLNTRMAKLDAEDSPYTALILAKAGLVRLGWRPRITADIVPPTLFHATEWRCAAERSCLRVLEGGCSVPVGVSTELVLPTTTTDHHHPGSATLKITGCVTSLTGDRHVQHSMEEEVKDLEGTEAVGSRLAKVLMETGAKAVLDEITKDREKRIGEAKTEDEKQKIEAAIAA